MAPPFLRPFDAFLVSPSSYPEPITQHRSLHLVRSGNILIFYDWTPPLDDTDFHHLVFSKVLGPGPCLFCKLANDKEAIERNYNPVFFFFHAALPYAHAPLFFKGKTIASISMQPECKCDLSCISLHRLVSASVNPSLATHSACNERMARGS